MKNDRVSCEAVSKNGITHLFAGFSGLRQMFHFKHTAVEVTARRLAWFHGGNRLYAESSMRADGFPNKERAWISLVLLTPKRQGGRTVVLVARSVGVNRE